MPGASSGEVIEQWHAQGWPCRQDHISTIGTSAFANTKLTYLDLSEATSLVEIGDCAFLGSTDLAGMLKVGPAVKTIGPYALYYTEHAGLDLWDATSLVSIKAGAFSDT